MMAKHLGIGLIGSGFNAKFHLLGFVGVRNADVLGVWSPNRKHAEETAALALALEVGEAKVYRSITEMVDRKSTRLNSSHANISYAVFCLKKKKKKTKKRN